MSKELNKVCVSCGNSFNGNYCGNCGEKVVIPEERTLKYFFGEVFNAFTFADNKTLKTIRYLFIRPGVLPLRYVEGQRKLFIAPLPLFLLINLVYFLFNPLDTFNSHFVNQLSGQPYSGFIQPIAKAAMQQSELTNQFYEAAYNNASQNISKSILLLFPVLFAFPLWGLFYKKSTLLFDHLMLSISFMSFVLLGLMLLIPALIIGILTITGYMGGSANFDWNGSLATGLVISGFCLYLGVALKNFYKVKWLKLIPVTLLLFIGFTFLMYLYRFILFFLTIWSI